MSEPVILPPKYYLTYFDYLIDFVAEMYGHLLKDSELYFLSAYRSLPEDARCLFIRMSNRKGRYFKTSLFTYAEIASIPYSLSMLKESGFARHPDRRAPGDISELLELITKPDLMRVTAVLQPVIMPSKNIRKPDLVRWLLHEYPAEQLLSTVYETTEITEVMYTGEVELMKFLFFGNRHDDMTEFVVRDLGHVRFQSFEEDSLSQRFQNRKELDDALAISKLGESFSEQITTAPPEEVFEWFMGRYREIIADLSPSALPPLNRLVVKSAGWMERNKLSAQALELYKLTTVPPARERKARLLYKMGYTDEAINLCLELVDSPQNADELYFGKDFLDKLLKSRKKVIRQTTLALHEAGSITIPVSWRYQVESGAIDHYLSLGYQAFFSENFPWRSIFGLLFWDIIYDTNVQAIHHPLQKVPSDFFLPDFYEKRAHLLRERASTLTSRNEIIDALSTTYHQKYGVANVLVGWHDELLDQILTITDLLTVDQLYGILMEMATDLKDKTRGFPDLLIWKDDEYSFVEIKSPTDHLSSRQLYWQHFFKKINVSSKIVRVKWQNNLETDFYTDD